MSKNPDQHDVLDYLSPRDDVERKRGEQKALALAAATTSFAIWFLVFVWVVSNLNLAGAPRPPNIAGPLIGTVAVAAAIITPAIIRWRRGRRAFALGVLIGIVIACSTLGLCFIANR